MHNIYDCVDAFSRLLHTEYKIVIGRKGITKILLVRFDKKDCFHLMGLQYLKDREELNKDREKVFNAIKDRKINVKHIEASHFYQLIEERVDMLPLLETLFDSNETVFKYNRKQNAFSMIQADYLMKNQLKEKNIYIFLSNETKDLYFCRSFFAEGKHDYAKNQSKWTLLYKEKINHLDGTRTVLYDRVTVENMEKNNKK